MEGAESVIIGIYNMAILMQSRFTHLHQHLKVDDLIQQILTRLKGPNWVYNFRFVYSERNRVSEYLSLVGEKLFSRLYIFYEPIERIREQMNLDLGLGPQNP